MHHGYHEDHEVERIKEYLTMNAWWRACLNLDDPQCRPPASNSDRIKMRNVDYIFCHLLGSAYVNLYTEYGGPSNFSLNQKKIAVFSQLRGNANHTW